MPTTSQLLNDPKFQGAIKCVKAVRKSPGVVREQDLRASWAEVGPRPLSSVNDALGFEALVAGEPNPSNARPRLDVVCTNPEWRLMIDLLLGHEDPQFRQNFGLAPFAKEIVVGQQPSHPTKHVRVILTLEKPDQASLILAGAKSEILTGASKIYAKLGHGRVSSWVPSITMEEICTRVRRRKMDWSNDLAGKVIWDFDAHRLPQGYEIRDLNASRSIFTGSVCSFDGLTLQGRTTFRNTVFLTANLSVRRAEFISPREEISFRNARIFAKNVDFTHSNFHAEKLSFEDAQVAAPMGESRIFFSRSDFTGVELDFFQTRAPAATIQFADCSMGDKVNFRDSEFSHVAMLTVDLGDADLRFRPRSRDIVRLEIDKSRATGTLKVDNVQQLCLFGTVLRGGLITEGRTKGRLGRQQVTALKAIDAWPTGGLTSREDARRKAQQFWALKHNFQMLGEYEMEDEALSLFMKSRGGDPASRIIGWLSSGIIKPIRILPGLAIWILIFVVLFWAQMACFPQWFEVRDSYPPNPLTTSLLLSFSRALPISTNIELLHPIPAALSFVESAGLWLFPVVVAASVARRLT